MTTDSTSTRAAEPIRLLDLGCVEAPLTQALYHAVADGMTAETPDTLILCRPQTAYLSLGYHQLYDELLDRQACRARGLPVYRRRVGGGLTYLDPRQVFYQCIFHHSRLSSGAKSIYRQLLAGPVATLHALGLRATLRADNEIEVDGRRVAGVGGARLGEACVVVGNLLINFDFETLAGVWNAPSESFRTLAASALRERLTILSERAPDATPERLESLLREQFGATLRRPLRPAEPTAAEWQRTAAFAHLMASREYLDLHADARPTTPMRRLKIAAGVFVHALEVEAGGRRVRVSLIATDGTITAATATDGDEQVAERMIGTPLADWQARTARPTEVSWPSEPSLLAAAVPPPHGV